MVLAGLLAAGPLPGAPGPAKEALRILTWEGYVTGEDLAQVNRRLAAMGYAFEAKVIAPYAEGADQMFDLIREHKVDISFLTLFFIQLQKERTSRLIQPIDTRSPRLGNYRFLLPNLTHLPMGMRGAHPLYLPFAGGSYGFYGDRNKVAAKDLPKAWGDLLEPRWKGRYSLNRTQVWYNVAIAAMALGHKPFFLNDLAEKGDREAIIQATKEDGPLRRTLTALYRQAGGFWDAAPSFPPDLWIVSSWGTEVKQANAAGGNWRLIHFREGDLVWMDTINFVTELRGRKLEAAEVVANYFLGKEVQSRVSRELSLVSPSTLAATNPILKANPGFFTRGHFVPPYHPLADNAMRNLSSDAFLKLKSP
jgi:spermidine/putrescine-binding protein